MSTNPKSFRLAVSDISKLKDVHDYYKTNYTKRVQGGNMDNLYKWSEAQTIAVLIRDRHSELVKSGEILDE